MDKAQSSPPPKLAQKVGKPKPAAQKAMATAATEAPPEKKLSFASIMLSLFLGLAAGGAAFVTTSQIFLAIGIFIGVTFIMLAFLSGAISLGSILGDEPEDDAHEEEHEDEHHSQEEHYES